MSLERRAFDFAFTRCLKATSFGVIVLSLPFLSQVRSSPTRTEAAATMILVATTETTTPKVR